MSFKLIRTEDGDLTRVQQNVAEAFAELAAAPASGLVEVDSDYRATGREGLILVSAQAGPVLVMLPEPDASMPRLTVKRVTAAGNGVTVRATDNSPIDGAETVALVELWDSVTLLASPAAYFEVG